MTSSTDAIANLKCLLDGYYIHAGAVPFSEAAFGQGTGSIFLDEVTCSGTEIALLNCSNIGLSVHDCSHLEDAGVRCQGEVSQ